MAVNALPLADLSEESIDLTLAHQPRRPRLLRLGHPWLAYALHDSLVTCTSTIEVYTLGILPSCPVICPVLCLEQISKLHVILELCHDVRCAMEVLINGALVVGDHAPHACPKSGLHTPRLLCPSL